MRRAVSCYGLEEQWLLANAMVEMGGGDGQGSEQHLVRVCGLCALLVGTKRTAPWPWEGGGGGAVGVLLVLGLAGLLRARKWGNILRAVPQ